MYPHPRKTTLRGSLIADDCTACPRRRGALRGPGQRRPLVPPAVLPRAFPGVFPRLLRFLLPERGLHPVLLEDLLDLSHHLLLLDDDADLAALLELQLP